MKTKQNNILSKGDYIMKKANVVCAVLVILMGMYWIGSLISDFNTVAKDDHHSASDMVTELEQETDEFVDDVAEYCYAYYVEMEQ